LNSNSCLKFLKRLWGWVTPLIKKFQPSRFFSVSFNLVNLIKLLNDLRPMADSHWKPFDIHHLT